MTKIRTNLHLKTLKMGFLAILLVCWLVFPADCYKLLDICQERRPAMWICDYNWEGMYRTRTKLDQIDTIEFIRFGDGVLNAQKLPQLKRLTIQYAEDQDDN